MTYEIKTDEVDRNKNIRYEKVQLSKMEILLIYTLISYKHIYF